MGFISCFAAWCPHNKENDIVDHSDTLESAFIVWLPYVLPSQEVTIEKCSQLCQIDPMLSKIDLTLRFIPSDHSKDCICTCIYRQPQHVMDLSSAPNVNRSPAHAAEPPASATARQHALGLVL